MRKIMVIQRSNTTETEYSENREKAGRYFATHLSGDFILLEGWLKDFNSKKPTDQLHVLCNVLEEADVMFLVSGWTQDPMCRVLYEVAGMLGKTVVEDRQ